MTPTAIPVTRPDARALTAVLDDVRRAVAARRVADRDLLVAAVAWAEAHPAPPDERLVGEPDDWSTEQAVPLAGRGAPEVAEFAAVELGAALGWSLPAARSLMGDGLDLKHRLPRTWLHVLDLRVPVGPARHLAAQARDLSPEAAAHADRLVAADPGHVGRLRIERLVDEARLYGDPDRAVDDELTALAERKVSLEPGRAPLTTDVRMTLDALDAEAFDAAVARAAESLRRLGDEDPLDVRRARAVGVLADPRRALDLFAGRDPGPRSLPSGVASLVLHLDAGDLDRDATDPAVVRIEGRTLRHGSTGGPVLLDALRWWLPEGTSFVVRPVLDLDRADAVDGHDPPGWLDELVRLRDPHCVFPGCQVRSRACDLDHIRPYLPIARGGPPAQTRADNLAPLCRAHHRAKTLGDWRYARSTDGGYRWTSPTGSVLTVLPAPRRPDPPRRP